MWEVLCRQKIRSSSKCYINNVQPPPAVAISIVGALRISTQLARPTISVHNTRTKATDAPSILNFEIQAEFLKATHMERTRKWFGDTYWTILNSLQYFCKSPHFDNPGWTHTQHPSQGNLLHILRKQILLWGKHILNANWQCWLDNIGQGTCLLK